MKLVRNSYAHSFISSVFAALQSIAPFCNIFFMFLFFLKTVVKIDNTCHDNLDGLDEKYRDVSRGDGLCEDSLTIIIRVATPRADLDMKTLTRWRLLCLYKDISVIISHSIAVIHELPFWIHA